MIANNPGRGAASLLSAQFVLLFVATGLFGLSFSAYFLLPKFLAVELQADAATIGGVSAIAMLASVVFMPIVGIQVDKHGRKVFGCLGAFLFAASAAGFLYVDSIDPLLWLLRLLQGASFTLFYIAFSTLATDISPPERLGQAIGLFGAVMISTNALGPALAEWGASAFSWNAVFACSIVTSLLCGAVTLVIHEHRERPGHETVLSMRALLKRPGLGRILLVAILTGCTLGVLFTFHQPWALEVGYAEVSSYLIAFAVMAMFVRVGLGGLPDRIGRLRVAQGAIVLYVASPLSLIWLDQLGLAACGALLGLAHGLFFPALNAVAVDFAAASQRGKAMAAYHGSFNIGFAAGSYFLGYVAIATSYPTIFALTGGICFCALVLLRGSHRMAVS